MENFKKWAENHPPIISIFGSWAASSCEAIFTFLEITKTKSIVFDIGQTPSTQNWLPLYESPDQIRNCVINLLKQFEDIPQFLGSCWEYTIQNPDCIQEGITEIKQLPPKEQIQIFKEVNPLVYELQEEFFFALSEELEKIIDDDKIHLFEIAEIKFIFSVVIPSYAFYGIDPFQIFKRAQKGSLKDIDKILRLDRSALGDPQIFQHFHNASKSPGNTDDQTIILALQKPPKGLTSLQKIKYKIAGLISGIAEMLNYKLSAPDIENLFDALSKDFDNPDLKLVETNDINNESIAKHINREKKFWYEYLKRDKKYFFLSR